ncbi:hypothetical protein KEN51_CDS0006 [Pseudomonas phage vB_Pae10145-KEN51]
MHQEGYMSSSLSLTFLPKMGFLAEETSNESL